jgi:hypothetical protein
VDGAGSVPSCRPPRRHRVERAVVPAQREAAAALEDAVPRRSRGEADQLLRGLVERARTERHLRHARASEPLPPASAQLVALGARAALATDDVEDLGAEVRLRERAAAAHGLHGVEHGRVVEQRVGEPVQQGGPVVVRLLLDHGDHPGPHAADPLEEGVDRRRHRRVGVGVDEEAVELEHGVEGDRLPRDDVEHPWAEPVQLVGADAPEGEGDVERARELGEADAHLVGTGRRRRADAGDAEVGRAALALGQGVDQLRPLEALHDAQVHHVHGVAALERVQDGKVRRGVGELEVRPGLVEAAVELARRGGRRRRVRVRRGEPMRERGGEVVGDAADPGGGGDPGEDGVRVVQVGVRGGVVARFDGAGAGHEDVDQADGGGLLRRGGDGLHHVWRHGRVHGRRVHAVSSAVGGLGRERDGAGQTGEGGGGVFYCCRREAS